MRLTRYICLSAILLCFINSERVKVPVQHVNLPLGDYNSQDDTEFELEGDNEHLGFLNHMGVRVFRKCPLTRAIYGELSIGSPP